MAETVKNTIDALMYGTINTYAVRYSHHKKKDNISVSLPEDLCDEFLTLLREDFVGHQNEKEVAFNPTLNGFEDGTYEYVSLDSVREITNEIIDLVNYSSDYRGENRKKVPCSNLYIYELKINDNLYYLCAKQTSISNRILKGKVALFASQDKLRVVHSNEMFLIEFGVSFLIDTKENKLVIFDKKTFQDIFHFDDYLKKMVQQDISKVDEWKFLASSEVIKNYSNQKTVYKNLAKVFADKAYMEEIKKVSPSQLKNNLCKRCSKYFSEDDFVKNKLIVKKENLDIVVKMLSKGFKYNFFTNNAEN